MKRILTGDRPTGKLHLGHYLGSLQNRVNLQNDYDTYIMVADVQALTDNFNDPQKVRDNVLEVTMDNLAVGLDPEKVTFFIQSEIPQIAELTVYFMNLVTMARLMRNPTVKDEINQKGFGDDVPVGFVNYPISQAADILFLKADLVPVGEDQLPMIEQTREIARKFNSIYGQVFPEPEAKIGRIARLVGTDGNAKMSKSIGNTIYLSDDEPTLEKKVMAMYTDPNRIHPTDPGKVEGNPVFAYLDAFASDEHQAKIADFKDSYQKGTVGDVEVKKFLINVLNQFLQPIRERRRQYEQNPQLVLEILKQGTAKTLHQAESTMAEVKQAMKLDYF